MISARIPRLAQLTAITLGAVFALSLSGPAEAQWKWKDKGGRVQYSDIPPPPSVVESDILQRPNGASRLIPQIDPKSAQAAAASQAAAAASVAAASAKPAEPELEAKRKKAAEEDAAKKKAEEDKTKAARAENCSRAQGQMRALNDGMRMARVNAKGEREVLDDAQRAAEVRRMQEVVNTDCK